MVAYYGPQHNLDILNRRSSDIEKTSPISSKEAPAAEELYERQAAIEFVEETSNLHEDKDFSGNEKMLRNIETLYKARERTFGYQLKDKFTADELAAINEDLKSHYHIAPDSDAQGKEIDPSTLAPGPAEIQVQKQSVEPSPEPFVGKTDPDAPKKPKDVHLGRVFIDGQNRIYEFNEKRIKQMIDKLTELNGVNKNLADFITCLTACKEKGKADFTDDKETQGLIDELYKVNPKIFGKEKSYVFNTEKQIDVLLAGLDAEVKAKIAEVNQTTMLINVRFDERIQYTENARKVLEMLIRHIESIISKYHKS